MANIPSELANRLRAARRVAVLSGAGVSAESGLPTFRDAMTGLWAQYRPEDLATPQAFRRSPKLVWEWYEWRRSLVANAEPNPAHRALAAMERHVPHFTLITQNVDGLHQRAGSSDVIELHGNISRNKCFDENLVVESWEATGVVPPLCPRCGGLLRPDVVWFGENLPAAAWDRAIEAAEQSDLFFTIGTSGVVQPAASLSLLADRNGAAIVVINLEAAEDSHTSAYVIKGPAGQVLPDLLAMTWPGG